MYFLSLLLLFFPMWAKAQEYWIQAPSSEFQDYKAFLQENPQRLPYRQYLDGKWEQSLRPLQEALPVANLDSKSSLVLIENLKSLEAETAWSSEGLYYLRDYLQAVLESGPLNSKLQSSYQQVLCHYQTLLQETSEDLDCRFGTWSLNDFQKLNPEIEMLYMNHLRVQLPEQTQLKADPRQQYHWHFLSSKHKAQTLQGRPDEILRRKIELETIVTGRCSEFLADKSVAPSGSQVFFSQNRQRPLQDAGLKAPWYKNNKKILIGLGLLAAGWYLHDKTVVFTLPSF